METHSNITPKVQKLINGQTIFRLKNTGNMNITATCDNQTVSIDIHTNPQRKIPIESTTIPMQRTGIPIA